MALRPQAASNNPYNQRQYPPTVPSSSIGAVPIVGVRSASRAASRRGLPRDVTIGAAPMVGTRGLGQAQTFDSGPINSQSTGQSGAVSTLQNQEKAAGGGATVTDLGSPMPATAPATVSSTTVATDSTNAQLIAGQNATKVQTLSTASTNYLLYGIGALAIGGVIAVAVYRSRRSRRRR